jgi:hypothetical protein
VLPIIKQVKKAGATTLQQIANALNDRRRDDTARWKLVPEQRAQRPGARLRGEGSDGRLETER